MKEIAEGSPRFKARLAGIFQLFEAITAAYGQVIVLGSLVVNGNAATTAANILGHERLFWLGFTSSLIGVAFHIAWVVLIYELLKPVNKEYLPTCSFCRSRGMRYTGYDGPLAPCSFAHPARR
jgi:Domain of unknown function (DUF4386)